VERRDLYQDDLTEERLPSPAYRDDVAATEVLDPDTLDDGDAPKPAAPQPRATTGDPDEDDDDDEDEDDDEDDDEE
jgi:hypothetical protein